MTPESNSPTTKDVCIFISHFASWLLGCGATCTRIEKNSQRIASTYGKSLEMTIMPRHIHLTLWNNDHTDSYTNIESVHHGPISFNINAQLSKLSWLIADNKINFDCAVTKFNDIINNTHPANKWLVLILASIANASFCRLFGGDFAAMAVIFLSTLAGYRLKQIMLEHKYDVRLVFFCSAILSSVLSAACHLFQLGDTPEIAIASSVLYLIPGIPYINSVSDLIAHHYICAYTRFMDSLVLTTCLSCGLCGGLLLMQLNWF